MPLCVCVCTSFVSCDDTAGVGPRPKVCSCRLCQSCVNFLVPAVIVSSLPASVVVSSTQPEEEIKKEKNGGGGGHFYDSVRLNICRRLGA